MIENIHIVVYNRVSSAAQSLELQESAATRYLESRDLVANKESIMHLSDNNVSATKYSMYERPKLMKLIRLIKEGKVGTVICYKRDRFARNFYEYVEIAEIFIKHNVDVVYTASNEPGFQKKQALEAFYGMLAQMEGENLRTRTNDTRKQYPSRIFGYTKKKEKDQVNYFIDESKKDLIRTLFIESSNVNDEEQFIEFLLTRRAELTKPERIIRILTNPFYSAHYETNLGYQLLPHVEPIVSLETFLNANSQVDKFLTYYEEQLQKVERLATLTPVCGECDGSMKHRKANPLDQGYFVCRDNHKRVAISVRELNDLINQTVLDYVQTISIKHAEKIILKRIRTEIKNLLQKQKKVTSEYLDTSVEISTLDQRYHSSISMYLDKIRLLKEQSTSISSDISALNDLSNDIKTIKQLTKLELNLSQQEMQQLIELLVDEIHVFEDYIEIKLFLSVFQKDMDVS